MINITETQTNRNIIRVKDMEEGHLYKRINAEEGDVLYFICNRLYSEKIAAFSICGKAIIYERFTEFEFVEMQADIVLTEL